MKILLINPSQNTAYGKFLDAPVFFPMGLGYVGAVLEKRGHKVDLIDIDGQKITDMQLKDIVRPSGYGLIGITATAPTINNAFFLAETIKTVIDTTVVLGGVHPTLFPEHVMGCAAVDFVVRGEGEETIVELTDELDGGRDFTKTKGLSYRLNGAITHNPDRILIEDLDGLPFPISHRLNGKFYKYPNSLEKRVAPIMTSRGCPGRCAFCCTRKTFGSKVRYRSPQNVVDEMAYLKDNFGIQEIHIHDDNFITNKRFIIELKELIKEAGLTMKISLPNGVRADYFTEEMAGYLKEMGLYSLAFGIESGNQKVLDGVKKGIKLETSVKAMAIAKRSGFETWGFFMLGLPGDDRETINDTIKFSLRLDPDIAKFHILKPFPGTEVYEQFKRDGLLLSSDFDRYGIHSKPVHRLENLTDDDMVELQKKAYRTFYFRPGKIINQVLHLKSFERVKFMVKAAFNMFKILKGGI